MDASEFIHWDHGSNLTLLFDFALVILVFAGLRYFLGLLSHVSTTNELSIRDNPAFGVSLAGAVFAMAIVLAGAIYGEPVFTMKDSVVAVSTYGLVGIFLMGISRFIFDRLALPEVAISEEILKGNVAAAVLDAGNMIATAIIIYTVMIWVSDSSIYGVIDVVSGFAVSQFILVFGVYIRGKILSKKHKQERLSDHFKAGNLALAFRFTGRRIGIAFAIAAASNLIVYGMDHSYILLLYWVALSILVMFVLTAFSWIAQSVILTGVNADKEVIEEKNVAVGIVQCFIYISLGLLLAQFLA